MHAPQGFAERQHGNLQMCFWSKMVSSKLAWCSDSADRLVWFKPSWNSGQAVGLGTNNMVLHSAQVHVQPYEQFQRGLLLA